MTRLPDLAPRFETMTPEAFATHVSSLHSEPQRHERRATRTKLKVKITAKATKRPAKPGVLALTWGTATADLEFTGGSRGRQIARSALVAAALALKCEESPLERYLTDRYAAVIRGSSE